MYAASRRKQTPTILSARLSFSSRRCTSASTDILHSKTDPDVTSMKLSIPKPTSEMLPAIAPATTATRPSKAFHAIVKYSSLRPWRTAAVRSRMAVSTIPAVYNAAVSPLLLKTPVSRRTHGSSRTLLSSPGMTLTTGPFQNSGVGPSLHFDRGATESQGLGGGSENLALRKILRRDVWVGLKPPDRLQTSLGEISRKRCVYQDMAVCSVRCPSLLLRWLCGLAFTCRRHDPLQSQIGHHVPIVLIRVRRIDREQRQLR